MPFEISKGNYLKKVEDTQNLTTQLIQKSLKARIPNHILHIQFERNISISQSNLFYQ